jgi:urocanate hydratase
MVTSLDEALRILKNAVRQRAARSVGLVGNAADVITELAERGVVPDLLTDRTAACDPLNGYWPQGLSLAAAEMRRSDPTGARQRSLASIAAQVRAMIELHRLGAVVFDFGNDLFGRAREAGVTDAASFPVFTNTYLAPWLGESRAPLRWIALSGEPADIERIDRLMLELLPNDEPIGRYVALAQKHVRAQGLPARACWFPRADRARFALAVNDLVFRGELHAPIVLARDFQDCGATADGSGDNAAAPDGASVGSNGGIDSPLVKAALDAASGASWGSIEGRGLVIVADGSPEISARIERVMAK